MNALIKIQDGRIGVDQVQTVSARELHAFLAVGKDFSTWIKGRIDQYGFVEHRDFVVFDAAPQNGGAGNRGHRVEYALTVDMAKELAMVERQDCALYVSPDFGEKGRGRYYTEQAVGFETAMEVSA